MKKIIYTVSLIFLLQQFAFAQLPSGRTSETKIADLLALQPAEDEAHFLVAMRELENFTTEDVSKLLEGLSAPGKGNNAKIEYASNSYSFHVMQSDKEDKRKVFAAGLISALDKLQDKDNKGYVLQLLEQSGKDENIGAIAPYLTDEYLAEKAARALNGIRTPTAVEALSQALSNEDSETCAIAIVSALGDLRSKEDEKAIIDALSKYSSPEFQKAGLFALSKIGGVASLKTFERKLTDVKFLYDETNTAGYAVDYASNLILNGHNKQAQKFAKNLYKKAGANTNHQTQIAALKLLTELNPRKEKKSLLKIISHPHASIRNVGFELLAQNLQPGDIARVLKAADKAEPEVQASIIRFVSQHGTADDASVLSAFVDSPSPEVKTAALDAVHHLNKQNDVGFLLDELSGADPKIAEHIKHMILSTSEGDPIALVNSRLADASKEEQLILLDILATRTNTQSFDAVLPLMSSDDSALKLAAYRTLPNLATESNLEAIINLLPNANDQEARFAQQAIVSAVEYSPNKDKVIVNLASKISRSSAPSAARYFPIFAGLGGGESLKAVQNYSNSHVPELKTSSLAALGAWSNPEVLPVLAAILREELTDNDFDIVFKGLVRNINASDVNVEQKSLHLRDAFEAAKNIDQKKIALTAMQNTGTYQSMIFAAQFLDDEELKGTATNTAMTIATEHPEYYGSAVSDLLEKSMANLSGSESSYLREAIIRHLSEMPKGEGYVSLFNGKDLTGWKGLVENPIRRRAMSADELQAKQSEADRVMREGWNVIDGELVFVGKGDNIATTKDYGDFEMLVDWKLDKDGEEGDAGVYLRGTPQVQIWDISRVNVGAQVGSGGLYNNQTHEANPSKVADNELGEWNTFKIRMVGDKVTVYLNGELVTDEVVLENYWDRESPIFPIEQIELQAHGTKVYYRDIFIKELSQNEVYTLTEEEQQEGFEVLFDGTDLDKWEGSANYTINDEGVLWVNPKATSGGNLYTKDEYADFVFRFDFKLTEGANNGVGIRTPPTGDAAYEGMEIQILDDDADVYKNLQVYQYHGSVYGIIPAIKGSLNPVGEWNTEEIHIKGDKIKVTVNGKVIVDGDLKEATKSGALDGKNHPGLARKSGRIAFLGHGSEVFFKNIRIKKL